MFSQLTQGTGNWDGEPTLSQEVSPLPWSPHIHRHGVTVKTQHKHKTFVAEDESGSLHLPKTYLTRKGALVLFSSDKEPKKVESLLKGDELERTISRLGNVRRLVQSVLFLNDAQETDPDINDCNHVSMGFLKSLDNALDLQKIKPGADLEYYLRALKRRSRQLSHCKEGHEISKQIEALLGHSANLYSRPNTSGSDRRVLSSSRLTASLKSDSYLGRRVVLPTGPPLDFKRHDIVSSAPSLSRRNSLFHTRSFSALPSLGEGVVGKSSEMHTSTDSPFYLLPTQDVASFQLSERTSSAEELDPSLQDDEDIALLTGGDEEEQISDEELNSLVMNVDKLLYNEEEVECSNGREKDRMNEGTLSHTPGRAAHRPITADINIHSSYSSSFSIQSSRLSSHGRTDPDSPTLSSYRKHKLASPLLNIDNNETYLKIGNVEPSEKRTGNISPSTEHSQSHMGSSQEQPSVDHFWDKNSEPIQSVKKSDLSTVTPLSASSVSTVQLTRLQPHTDFEQTVKLADSDEKSSNGRRQSISSSLSSDSKRFPSASKSKSSGAPSLIIEGLGSTDGRGTQLLPSAPNLNKSGNAVTSDTDTSEFHSIQPPNSPSCSAQPTSIEVHIAQPVGKQVQPAQPATGKGHLAQSVENQIHFEPVAVQTHPVEPIIEHAHPTKPAITEQSHPMLPVTGQEHLAQPVNALKQFAHSVTEQLEHPITEQVHLSQSGQVIEKEVSLPRLKSTTKTSMKTVKPADKERPLLLDISQLGTGIAEEKLSKDIVYKPQSLQPLQPSALSQPPQQPPYTKAAPEPTKRKGLTKEEIRAAIEASEKQKAELEAQQKLEALKPPEQVTAFLDSNIASQFDDDGGMTAEELELAQEMLKEKLMDAKQGIDDLEQKEADRVAEVVPEVKVKTGKKGRTSGGDPEVEKRSEAAIKREAARLKKKQEKMEREVEQRALREKMARKKMEARRILDKEESQRKAVEEEEQYAAAVAEEARRQEEDARLALAESRKRAREEREANRQAELERKKEDAIRRKQEQLRMLEVARQKELDMLEKISDAETVRQAREQERKRREEAEWALQAQLEEEERLAAIRAAEEEARLALIEQEAEEDAMKQLIAEREEAEREEQELDHKRRELAEIELMKRRQLEEEEDRIRAELDKQEKEEAARMEEERLRLEELQRLEQAAQERLKKELEEKIRNLMALRELNLEKKRHLEAIKKNQALTKPFVFSYYVKWPKETYEKMMGSDDKKKKKFKALKKKKK